MQTLVANGLLVDIGDLLNQYGQEMLDKAGILMDACKVGDGTYCVPGNYYPATVDSLVYDKEKVEEFNIQIPDNPEDSYDWLRKYYAAIKDSDYDGYGFSAGDGVTLSIADIIWKNLALPWGLRLFMVYFLIWKKIQTL